MVGSSALSRWSDRQAADAAVLAAYNFSSKATKSEIVAKLFEMYDKLAGGAKN